MALQLLWQQLAQARAKRGWSFDAAAKWFGVTLSTYWRWEQGLTQPTTRHALLVEAFARGRAMCPTCGSRVGADTLRLHRHVHRAVAAAHRPSRKGRGR